MLTPTPFAQRKKYFFEALIFLTFTPILNQDIDYTKPVYVDVILPLAIPKQYSYAVPTDIVKDIAFGKRVEVGLKTKLYSGIIAAIHNNTPAYKTRNIISVIDYDPVISHDQYKLWQWIASYYCCTIGEVMGIALPTGLKLTSETSLMLSPYYKPKSIIKIDKEYLITEALHHQKELKIAQIQQLLNQKTVYPLIKKMIDSKVLWVKEELKQKYKPKIAEFVSLEEEYHGAEGQLLALDKVTKSEKQTRAMLMFFTLQKKHNEVLKNSIYELADIDNSVIKAIVKKGIFKITKREISRFDSDGNAVEESPPLTVGQESAVQQIHDCYKEKNIVLLHGITGSGKTRVYIELIKEILSNGGQVLYLLPEIGLTTQMVGRIRSKFGDQVGIYHSKMNSNERVEIWKSAMDDKPIVLGARSSLLLPFSDLQLIIVDEEHDSSYKQNDPAPRYNARDVAVYMANSTDIKVLLGSATPSLESINNVRTGKYGYVEMTERFGDAVLPKIELIDLTKGYKNGSVKKHFTNELVKSIQEVLDRKEQALVFQNRRGFAPTLRCNTCGWNAECPNCDVTLTVHQYYQDLRCHYCGFKHNLIQQCRACGKRDLDMKGAGTEKIEDVLKEFYPDATIARMDYDTVKTKTGHEKILDAFGKGEIDILVGTQMITKGLDFDNITLVGILNADLSLNFPDFRANEKAYQLFTQVSGRAGRKEKPGRVLIQTYQPSHPTLREVISGDFGRFVQRELNERKNFIYPPYFRLIEITLKHRDPKKVQAAALQYSELLRKSLGRRIIGPATPGIARVRSLYLKTIIVKLERDSKAITKAKKVILEMKAEIRSREGFKTTRINIDVDPY